MASRPCRFTEAEVARLVAGALRGGMPVGSFQITVDNDGLRLLPANSGPASDADVMERRMQEAFDEDEVEAPVHRRTAR